VTLRFPTRTNFSNTARSNRSTGRLLPPSPALAPPRAWHNWRSPASARTRPAAVEGDRQPARHRQL